MIPAEQGFTSAGALSDTDARLIWELVANIHPAPEVLSRYGLTAQDLKRKMADGMWMGAYREAKAIWASTPNVQQRIKFKAGLLLEDSLADLMVIIKDPMMGVTAKLEATKQLGQLSQTLGAKPGGPGGEGGSGFKLTINLGGAQQPVTIDGRVLQHSLETSTDAV